MQKQTCFYFHHFFIIKIISFLLKFKPFFQCTRDIISNLIRTVQVFYKLASLFETADIIIGMIQRAFRPAQFSSLQEILLQFFSYTKLYFSVLLTMKPV